MNFNDVAIVSIKVNDYRIHFWYMSKDDVINSIHNSSLNEEIGSLINVLLYIKNDWSNPLSKNRQVILNRANEYYENNKEVLREKVKKKYRELSETDIIICLKERSKY